MKGKIGPWLCLGSDSLSEQYLYVFQIQLPLMSEVGNGLKSLSCFHYTADVPKIDWSNSCCRDFDHCKTDRPVRGDTLSLRKEKQTTCSPGLKRMTCHQTRHHRRQQRVLGCFSSHRFKSEVGHWSKTCMGWESGLTWWRRDFQDAQWVHWEQG